MKKLFLIMFMALAQFYVFGQGKIVFSEVSKDLGEINTIEKDFEVNFRFKNDGNEPLKIEKVSIPFKTAKAFYPKTDIQPGEEGVITIKGFLVNSGSFKKSATILTTGLVAITRLSFSGKNINPSNKDKQIEDLAQGGSYLDWIKMNLKGNLVGIDKNIICNVKLGVQIDNQGKISKYEYDKNNLSPSICKEIDRLIKDSPDFSYFLWDSKLNIDFNIYDYSYSNSADKAYYIVHKSPDITRIVQSVNGGAEILWNHFKIDELNKNNSVPLFFIVEKNGEITNVKGALNNNYCTKDNISRVNKIIEKIKALGKVKPGEQSSGKPCRTICLIKASLNQ